MYRGALWPQAHRLSLLTYQRNEGEKFDQMAKFFKVSIESPDMSIKERPLTLKHVLCVTLKCYVSNNTRDTHDVCTIVYLLGVS